MLHGQTDPVHTLAVGLDGRIYDSYFRGAMVTSGRLCEHHSEHHRESVCMQRVVHCNVTDVIAKSRTTPVNYDHRHDHHEDNVLRVYLNNGRANKVVSNDVAIRHHHLRLAEHKNMLKVE